MNWPDEKGITSTKTIMTLMTWCPWKIELWRHQGDYHARVTIVYQELSVSRICADTYEELQEYVTEVINNPWKILCNRYISNVILHLIREHCIPEKDVFTVLQSIDQIRMNPNDRARIRNELAIKSPQLVKNYCFARKML